MKRYTKKYFHDGREYFVVKVHFIYNDIDADHRIDEPETRSSVTECYRVTKNGDKAVFRYYVWKRGVECKSIWGDIEKKLEKEMTLEEYEDFRKKIVEALSNVKNKTPEVKNVFRIFEQEAKQRAGGE